jgi:predicted  nucleic acid-binding Zn-ribbon protein
MSIARWNLTIVAIIAFAPFSAPFAAAEDDLKGEGARLQSEQVRLKAEEDRLRKLGQELFTKQQQLNKEADELTAEENRLLKVQNELKAERERIQQAKDRLEACLTQEEEGIKNDVNRCNEKVQEYNWHAARWGEQFQKIYRDVPRQRDNVKRYAEHLSRTRELIEDTAPFWAVVVYPRSPNLGARPEHWKQEAQWFNALSREVSQQKKALEDRQARAKAKAESDLARLKEQVQTYNQRADTFGHDLKAFNQRDENHKASLNDFRRQATEWKQNQATLKKQADEWAKSYERYLAELRESRPVVVQKPSANSRFWLVFYAHDNMVIGHTFVAWIHEDEKQQVTVMRAVGFYPGAGALPDPLPKNLDTFTWMIAGAPVPGEILDEFKRWEPASKAYLTIPVTREVFEKTQAVMREWKDKPYRLHTKPQNCIDFVEAVAKACGLKLPDRSQFTFPAAYAKKLQELNQ